MLAVGGLVMIVGVGSAQIGTEAQPVDDEAGEVATGSFVTDEQDREWLGRHRVIRVGAEINYAPYEFRDVRGRFTGVVADYLELIRQRLGADPGVRFEIVQLPEFGAVEEKLRQREVDVVLALTPSQERAGYLGFTKPYLQYVNVIVTRDNHEFVTGLADFTDRRIAVVRGHSAQQLVARAYPSLQVTAYSDILDALMAVSTGKEDGLVDDIFPVVHNIRHRQIGNLKLATPLEKSLQASGFSIAVRNDWPELVGILDRMLDTITPEEQREISQKWLSVRYENKVDYRAIWTAVAVFSVLLAAAVLWIRQLRRQRAALEAARAQAEAANRAKDGFLAGMSHELRTPLHAILGYAELLREGRVAGQSRNDALATIAGSGRHLLALINDLLDLSRIRSGHLELRPAAIRLQGLIDDVAAMIRIEAGRKSLEFEVRYGTDLPAEIEVDDKRLRQVLLNLLGNAIKFTDAGSVTLGVRAEVLSDARALLCIEVDDTGKGIDLADRERIFSPFEQGEEGRRRESGVGLGLAISREIVQRMQGSITVSSRPGGGSRFSVRVPVPVVSGAVPAHTVERLVVGYQGVVRRILVVDDQPENTALIDQMLRPLGFEVRTANSAALAVEAAQAAAPDLVVMDLRMPEVNGFDCARTLRELPGMAALPIVAASASAADLSRAQAEHTLFARQLRKPFHLQDLLGVLESALGLDWRHAAAMAQAEPDVEGDEVEPPSPECLREIRHYAHLGKWLQIERIGRELAGQDGRYEAFTRQLQVMAHSFDEARLEHFVEKCLGIASRNGAR